MGLIYILLLPERESCSNGGCYKNSIVCGSVDHGLRIIVENGVTLLQGLHSYSQWQGQKGVCACLS